VEADRRERADLSPAGQKFGNFGKFLSNFADYSKANGRLDFAADPALGAKSSSPTKKWKEWVT
jgi:hypothetical protein